MINANWLATLAIFGLILSSLSLLWVKKPEETAIYILVAAWLFMPVGAAFTIPAVAVFDRDILPYTALLITYWIRRSGWVSKNRPGFGPELMLAGTAITAFFTTAVNGEGFQLSKYTAMSAPGLNWHDTFSFIRADFFMMGVPFILGRLLMRTPEQGTQLVKAIAVGGLIYTFFIMIELRMSPQLHFWFYGQAARADFSQAVRGGGYRPIVFLPHGLAVALYMSLAVLASVTLWRAKQKLLKRSWKPFFFYLSFMLILCKSMAALIYAVLMAPLAAFGKARTQVRIAVVLAALFLIYPTLRTYDMFPDQTLLDWSEKLGGEDKKGSLATRFDSERMLLERAHVKLWWGWGGHGRASVYNDYGQEIAIFDGFWISALAHRGSIYLLVVSLLLTWPVFVLSRRWRKIQKEEWKYLAGGLALILGIALVDLLPNGLFLNYPFFLSGALYGLVRRMQVAPPPDEAAALGPARYSAGPFQNPGLPDELKSPI